MRSIRLMLGVTLLEVMLVLSIVSLIILMSVRYYQATTNASQTQQGLALIQALSATADNLAMGDTGGYSNATSANMKELSGAGILASPWGGTVAISAQTPTTYKIVIPNTPVGVCDNVKNKLSTDSKFTFSACSGGASGITYTYNATS